MNVLIVPRWAGTPDADWYPWLVEELGARRVSARVVPMPEPDAPAIGPWLAALNGAVEAPERTVLVGHSIGCQAILRYAAATGRPIGGAVLVAAWWWANVDWVALKPWVSEPYDVAAARKAIAKATVLISDNDPYTPETEANRSAWEARLGAAVTVVPGAEHFNEDTAPAVLDAVLALLQA